MSGLCLYLIMFLVGCLQRREVSQNSRRFLLSLVLLISHLAVNHFKHEVAASCFIEFPSVPPVCVKRSWGFLHFYEPNSLKTWEFPFFQSRIWWSHFVRNHFIQTTSLLQGSAEAFQNPWFSGMYNIFHTNSPNRYGMGIKDYGKQ